MRNLLYIAATLIFTGCVWNTDEDKVMENIPMGLSADTTVAVYDSGVVVDTDTARYPIGFNVTVEDWKLKKG